MQNSDFRPESGTKTFPHREASIRDVTDSATASAEEKNYHLTRVATAFVSKGVTNVSHSPRVVR